MSYISLEELSSDQGMTDEEMSKYSRQLQSILTSFEGTVPGSRGFGVSGNFIDMDPDAAVNLIAVELAENVAKYIPDIQIQSVSAAALDDGKLSLEIKIGRNLT
jgi:two-component sensor histidine kinase